MSVRNVPRSSGRSPRTRGRRLVPSLLGPRARGLLCVAAALVGLTGCGSGSMPGGPVAVPPPAAPPSAAPAQGAGAPLSPADLQGRWWTWASSTAGVSNPVLDPDGHACAFGQPGDLWFLAGTFGGYAQRTCAVPVDRPLVFPLVNLASSQVHCEAFMGAATGEAVLDDQVLPAQRMDAVPIVVESVEGNPVTGTAGSVNGYGCGLWAQVGPLSPGVHFLTIKGQSGDHEVWVDYRLEVHAEPGRLEPGPEATPVVPGEGGLVAAV